MHCPLFAPYNLARVPATFAIRVGSCTFNQLMRIETLHVENFRAIRLARLVDIREAIVIAGPNGCGKSAIFDALRLLKSAYGQYHQNEFQSWLNEFQIKFENLRRDAARVFHDPSKELRIEATIRLAPDERTFLYENAKELLLKLNWAQFHRDTTHVSGIVMNPTRQRKQSPIVESQAAKMVDELKRLLEAEETHRAILTMQPGEEPTAVSNALIETVFTLYEPENLGIIDYYGPHRVFGREQLSNIHLRVQEPSERGQHALYNIQNKYANIKTQMAQTYVRQMLAREAGVELGQSIDLKETLDELFEVFFPGKKFLGILPTPEGELTFPVRLESGREHDINELSSGEREVLIGYLRLRNSAPCNSVILIDEPELHLNPRLIRGLPRFYQKHIGTGLCNQLWMITHSDTLLREAVEEPAYDVYHMQPSYATDADENQLVKLSVSADLERAIISLVGDLASYSPRSKVVLLEGEASEVDASIISELFPEFADKFNLVSVGSKLRVGAVHTILDQAASTGQLDARFFSIVDRDWGETVGSTGTEVQHRFSWDVYHIENYLLEASFVREAMRSLALRSDIPDVAAIDEQLKQAAHDTIDSLVRDRLERRVNKKLVRCINTRSSPTLPLAGGLRSAAEASAKKIAQALDEELAVNLLQGQETAIRSELEASLSEGRWRADFRGRDILRKFCALHPGILGISYEKFRNLIINRMREAGYRPGGMRSVLEQIDAL